MPIDTAGTVAGLQALARRVDDATRRITAGAGHIFQGYAMEFAPKGEADNSTNPPGDLARSIHVEGPEGGNGTYTALVGPTVTTVHPGPGGTVYNYGRQREFGGLLYAKATPYLAFWSHGVFSQKLFVYQFGSHYLYRSRLEGPDDIERLMDIELTIAVQGG